MSDDWWSEGGKKAKTFLQTSTLDIFSTAVSHAQAYFYFQSVNESSKNRKMELIHQMCFAASVTT